MAAPRPHREVIEVAGVSHGTMPIPMAVRTGNMVYSSGIHGFDPERQQLAQSPDRQIELAFQHMRSIVRNAGGDLSDIALVIFNIREESYRATVNREWLAMFPDENRPARNTHVMDLGPLAIHILMTAVLPERERP